MRRFFSSLLLTLLVSASFATGPAKNAKDTKDARETSVLPANFNGWQKNAASVKTSADPATVDPADSAVLKEYGFSDVETATYTRDDRKMQVKAARFSDTSGAFGAFTFYVQPQMQAEKISDQAVSNNTRILFYRGNVLVDVALDRITAMSAADLRALSDALPRPRGATSTPPTLPSHLPRQSYVPHTKHYVLGPVAMERLQLPLPSSLVDFSKSPEIASAQYKSSEGKATVILIAYPTPQIAGERMRALQSASLPGGPFEFKKSGPIVAIVSGNIPASEAQSLLASVNYDAEVTWNQPTKADPKNNIGNLIVGVFVLIGLLLVISLILGLAFGGVRVLAKKFFPNRVFDRPEDVEFIRLNLK